MGGGNGALRLVCYCLCVGKAWEGGRSSSSFRSGGSYILNNTKTGVFVTMMIHTPTNRLIPVRGRDLAVE